MNDDVLSKAFSRFPSFNMARVSSSRIVSSLPIVILLIVIHGLVSVTCLLIRGSIRNYLSAPHKNRVRSTYILLSLVRLHWACYRYELTTSDDDHEGLEVFMSVIFLPIIVFVHISRHS